MRGSVGFARIAVILCSAAVGCSPGLIDYAPETPEGGPVDGDPPGSIGTTPAPDPLCTHPEDGVSLCINEVQSNNDSTFQPSTAGIFPDWLELYNAGSARIDPGAVEVSIGESGPFFLDGEPIEPGAFRVVIVDDQEVSGHLPAKISSDGERIEVTLYGLLADTIDVPALAGDTAVARVPDGGSLTRICTGSPGLPNTDSTQCEDPLDWAFLLGRIHDLRLYLDATAWATLETSSTFNHLPAPGRLVFDGGEFPVIDVELKGGYGSFRSDLDSQKTAFKLDLNAYEDHDWHGLERLTLDNMVQDPTFTHEYLSYALYREAGVPAPLVGFARVWVNDIPFGFYSLIEPVDDAFLERWYGDGTGHLFEAAYGPDFDVGKETSFEYDEGLDVVAGQALLAEVSNLLATSPWDETTYLTLKTLVDMDEVMLNMVVEAAVWHWDGYTTENNYYLYHDPTTSLWEMIPHGTDQTWVDGWPNAFDGNGRSILYQFCFTVPSCLARYDQQVLEVADAQDRLTLGLVLDALIALTDPEFALDPRVEEAGERANQLVGTRSRIDTGAQALRDAAALH